MINTDFKNIADLLKTFPNESTCLAHLENLRWNNKPLSPFDASSKVYRCKQYQYRCSKSNKYFNVKTGSIFANSKVELKIWFVAIWLFTTNAKLNSVELSRALRITQKSAWYMLKRMKSVLYSEELVLNKMLSINQERAVSNIPIENETLLMGEWLNRFKK